MTEHVFGYGSLVADVDGTPADLRGAHRAWTVAMDNALDLPGYKHYLAPDGRRPPVLVAFLDLDLDTAGTVNGVCHAVAAHELDALDRRERQYERVDVTARLAAPPGRVWAYVGRPDSRDRAASGRADGTLRVATAYLTAVHAAFDRLGADHRRRFDASTDPPGVPVVDLRRVENP